MMMMMKIMKKMMMKKLEVKLILIFHFRYALRLFQEVYINLKSFFLLISIHVLIYYNITIPKMQRLLITWERSFVEHAQMAELVKEVSFYKTDHI
jgi:hypothetical protein